MEEFEPKREVKDMAGGDEGVDANVVPMAAATANVADDISPLAIASTSFPETPLEGVASPHVEEADSSFSDPPHKKEEAATEEEEDEGAVSSSTPIAPKPFSPSQEEEVEGEPIAALHLSGYFISLEDNLPSCLLDLIYWRQPLLSGAVFSSLFLLLLAFSLCSAVSVVSYVALLALAGTLSYVTFRKVAAAVQKSGEGHPFQELLELDVQALLSIDDFKDVIQANVVYLVRAADTLRGLFLIVNVFESIKLAVFLYAMTYVGEMFNLLTIFIIALVSIFTIPKIYEVYGADIDIVAEKLIAQAKAQYPVIKEQVVDRLMMIKDKVIASVPIGKEKTS